MSDKSDNEGVTEQTQKKKTKRVVSEAHREKLKANLAAARAAHTIKAKEKREGKDYDAQALRELIEEKKKTKVFGIQEEEPAEVKAPKASKAKKTKEIVSSESEESEVDEEKSHGFSYEQESESEEEEEEDSVSESSDSSSDEAEFVLKRKKTVKKPHAAVSKKAPVTKATKGKAEKKEKKSDMLAKLEAMTAEIAALKKEKRKQSKVVVNFNQPEKKSMSDKQRKDLLDL